MNWYGRVNVKIRRRKYDIDIFLLPYDVINIFLLSQMMSLTFSSMSDDVINIFLVSDDVINIFLLSQMMALTFSFSQMMAAGTGMAGEVAGMAATASVHSQPMAPGDMQVEFVIITIIIIIINSMMRPEGLINIIIMIIVIIIVIIIIVIISRRRETGRPT